MKLTVKPYILEEVYPLKDSKAWIDIVRLHGETLSEDLMKLPDYGYWFIIYHHKKPVAFAGLTEYAFKSKNKKTPKIGFLTRCGVVETHRGHGLQRYLIFARIGKAIEVGYDMLYTTTYCNPPSANNLISAGFKMFEPEHEWGIEGTNYWKLPLH